MGAFGCRCSRIHCPFAGLCLPPSRCTPSDGFPPATSLTVFSGVSSCFSFVSSRSFLPEDAFSNPFSFHRCRLGFNSISPSFIISRPVARSLTLATRPPVPARQVQVSELSFPPLERRFRFHDVFIQGGSRITDDFPSILFWKHAFNRSPVSSESDPPPGRLRRSPATHASWCKHDPTSSTSDYERRSDHKPFVRTCVWTAQTPDPEFRTIQSHRLPNGLANRSVYRPAGLFVRRPCTESFTNFVRLRISFRSESVVCWMLARQA